MSQPVFSAADPAQLAGHLYVTAVIFGRNVAGQAHVTLVLTKGQVDTGGVGSTNPFQMAVTGGTGRFQNARGARQQARVQERWRTCGDRMEICPDGVPRR